MDVFALRQAPGPDKAWNVSGGEGLDLCHQPKKLEAKMSKSDVQQAVKRAERQVENTSAGGHLGGTYYGQNPDGKTASTNKNVGKNRPNTGST